MCVCVRVCVRVCLWSCVCFVVFMSVTLCLFAAGQSALHKRGNSISFAAIPESKRMKDGDKAEEHQQDATAEQTESFPEGLRNT